MATEQQIQLRRGNATDWETVNPILGDGEPGWERDTGKMKVGDGVTAWNDLIYFSSSSGGGGFESISNIVMAICEILVPILPITVIP